MRCGTTQKVEPSKNFARRLGFIERGTAGMFADLTGFFDHPCEHGKASSAE